ncbi:MAG: tetratricopeptide repeat protein [Terriglobales bacterium]
MPRVGNLAYPQRLILCVVLAAGFRLASTAKAQGPNNFETLAASAESARDAGKMDDAIRDYQSGVDLRPTWVEGWWYLGTLLYDADRFAEAVPALHHVIDLDPKVAAGWAFLGLCEFETGDYVDAFSHLKTARELGFAESPDVEKVSLYHLALLLSVHGEFESATGLLVSSFGPSQFPEQIKIALGLALLHIPLLPAKVDPANDSLIHAAGETAALLADHELDAASQSFQQMLRDYPETPYLHYEYGVALAAASRDEQAQLQLREEIRITPRSAAPWIALATLDVHRNSFTEAVSAARRAVELAPRSAVAYQALAQALQSQGRSEEAATAAGRALELAKQPVDVDAAQIKRYALIRVEEAARNSDGSPLIPATAMSLPSANFEELVSVAESARQAGRLDEAVTSYRIALNLRSDWNEGWRQLGTLEYMQGHYPEAISALRQSVSLDGNLPDTWTLLGLSEFEVKDYKNSLIHLGRGRALGFSGNAAAVRISRYHLALLLNLNGDYDGALALLIPEVGPGALSEEIQFAMGIALLRIPALPGQVDPGRRSLVNSAGEAAALLSGSYYNKAFEIFRQLLTQYPDTPFLHYAYGDALASVSSYNEAQIQLKEETELNPTSELAYTRLATIALTLHRAADALEVSRKAVTLAPESAEAHYVLGRAFLEEGDAAGAIRELEAASGLAPNSPKVHFSLARAYAQANRAADADRERTEFERLNGERASQPGFKGNGEARGTIDDAPAPSVAK